MAGRSERYPRGARVHGPRLWLVQGGREVDTRTSSLELINEGKYQVGFKFLFKSKMMRNILKIEPEEGLLEPATEAPAAGAPPPKKGEPPPPAGGPSRLKIMVTLKADAEYTLKGNTDVRLRFTEPMTTEVMDNLTTPVRVMMHSVFSKSTLVPKGINFGPMVYAPSKERTFELTNTGEFHFNYTLRAAHRLSPPPQRRPPRGARPGGGGWLRTAGPLHDHAGFGRGNATGGSAMFVVKSRWAAGNGDEVNNETLVVYVADRDVGKEPDGVFYERAAEWCIPGIETKDCTNIFESRRCSAI